MSVGDHKDKKCECNSSTTFTPSTYYCHTEPIRYYCVKDSVFGFGEAYVIMETMGGMNSGAKEVCLCKDKATADRMVNLLNKGYNSYQPWVTPWITYTTTGGTDTPDITFYNSSDIKK